MLNTLYRLFYFVFKMTIRKVFMEKLRLGEELVSQMVSGKAGI